MSELKQIQRDLVLKQNVVYAAMDHVRGVMVAGVTRKINEAYLDERDVVPASVAGIRTEVVEVGVIRALDDDASAPELHQKAQSTELMIDINRIGKWRPAPGGISCGHHLITAGTLGMMVVKDGKHLILSNNHVLANSNDAQLGDPILQPGPYDGGMHPDDTIATLDTFVEINWAGDEPEDCPIAGMYAGVGNALAAAVGSGVRLRVVRPRQKAFNLVDCALAAETEPGILLCEILEIGNPGGYEYVVVQGDAVKKSGRTTGFNRGTVNASDATVQVSYGGNRVALFEDQIATTPMLDGGDSGSVLFLDTPENLVMGLGFAGSNALSIFNRIVHVQEALGFN